MQPRFVVVPAVPRETGTFRSGSRYYASAVSGGFEIYDNREQVRLKLSYQNKPQAEAECARMNMECPDPNERFAKPRTW